MTATLSLEPSLVRGAQWDRQAYAIGNQTTQLAHANILQDKTAYTLNFQENRNLLDAGFQNFG